ncbi:MAG: cobaltochelatase subunit CobN [Clostridia bacterium]
MLWPARGGHRRKVPWADPDEGCSAACGQLESSARHEMESLMGALSGAYVSPGPAGDAMSNGRGILPTGAISMA